MRQIIRTYIYGISLFLLLSNAFAIPRNSVNQVNFLLLSDPHVDFKNSQPVNINPNSKNEGHDLDEESFKYLTLILKDKLLQLPEHPSSMVILGDLPTHHAGKHRVSFLKDFFYAFYTNFSSMPIFYIFGNNDSIERDYGHFYSQGTSVFEIFRNVTNKGGFLSTGETCPYQNHPCVNNQSETNGFYSSYIKDHLKLIALNSVVFVKNKSGHRIARDGDEMQFEWLDSELKNSEANHDQVILAMHISPNTWLVKGKHDYKNKLKKMLARYPNVVIGMLAAHTHRDELHVIKSNTQTIPIIHSAGFGPINGNSASFKTIQIGRQTTTSPWMIENYNTYVFRGHVAKLSYIEKFYDFKSAFCTSENLSFNDCLNKQIIKSHHKFKFNNDASKQLNEHYYLSHAFYGNEDTKNWVMNY